MSYQSDLSKTRPGHSVAERSLWLSSAHSSLSQDVLQHQAFHQQGALGQPCVKPPPRDSHGTSTQKRLRECSSGGKKSACLLDSHFSQGHLTPRCSFPSNIFCPPRGAGVVHTGMVDLLDNAHLPLHGTQCPLEAASAWLHAIISHPPASHSEL